jgi:transposase-like protein
MQKQKRKQYAAEFKAKIVKEILREEKTVSQLSAEYGIRYFPAICKKVWGSR